MSEIIQREMASKSDITELAVELSKRTIELVYNEMKYMDPEYREQVEGVLIDAIPTAICNMIEKSPRMRSPAGIQDMEMRLDYYAREFAKIILEKEALEQS